eukprot:gene1364-biopygen4601
MDNFLAPWLSFAPRETSERRLPGVAQTSPRRLPDVSQTSSSLGLSGWLSQAGGERGRLHYRSRVAQQQTGPDDFSQMPDEVKQLHYLRLLRTLCSWMENKTLHEFPRPTKVVSVVPPPM